MSNLAKNIVLAFLVIVVLLALSEMIARLRLDPVNRINFTTVPKGLTMDSKYTGVPFSLRPNAVATQEFGSDPRGYFDPGATLTYRTNSLGFRGPDTPRERPPGTFRIVGLGDSFTFGTGVRFDDTFLSVLQREIRTARSDAYEVLNLGVMGYDTTNEVSRLVGDGVWLGPDLVVICFFLNDAGAASILAALEISDADPPWYRASRFVDHLMWRVTLRRSTQTVLDSYRDSFADDSEGWQEVRSAFLYARTLSERYQFRLAVMIFPVLWKLSDDYPFAWVHEKVKTHLDSLEIDVLDLAPAFEGYDGPDLWVHPSNEHPNENAHAIAGKTLYRFLEEKGLLDPAP